MAKTSFLGLLPDGVTGVYVGTGTPEGTQTATIGSIYLRKDGEAGTSAYLKETGTGDTGWTPFVTPGTSSGELTIKVSYIGSPGVEVFYQSRDLAGGYITSRTSDGVVESAITPGLYFYDQVVSVDQFVAEWDEADGLPPAREVVATRHTVEAPGAPTGITAAGLDSGAQVSFTPGDNGGAAVTTFTVTATDTTTPANGGQTQSGTGSPVIIGGLTNGDNYTFRVTASNGAGDSPQSVPSNSVTPAVVLRVPDPPTNAQAAVSASGTVIVTFDAPANNGGAAITSYLVTAIDETTSGNGGQTHAGNSPNTIGSLVNGDVYHFTVHATNSVGNSTESIASNSVTPTGAGSGVATFSYSQPTSSTVLLDATGSTGTLEWKVDGVTASATTTTLLVGPLRVGSHTIRLTATSGGAAISNRTIDVAWIAVPCDIAQNDATNGPTRSGVGADLSAWSDLDPVGPWRNKQVLNMEENYPGEGDGDSRITAYSDTHFSLMCRANTDAAGTPANYQGDWQGSGGYRNSMEMNTAYTGATSGYEFATANIDVSGNVGAPVGDGTTGHVRFYRIDLMIPGLPTNLMHTGGGTPYSNGTILYQNNFCEIHGNTGGSSPVRFQTNGAGTQVQWAHEQIVGASSGGQKNFDNANILWDTWYRYVVEFLLSTDETVGYIRIWRDYGLGAGNEILPMARCPTGTIGKDGSVLIGDPEYGKLYPTAPYATQQRTSTGVIVPQAWDVQNYRTRAALQTHPNYSDFTVHYDNIRVGPTMASVMA